MNLNHIPHSPGVYLMRDNQGKILYIGKAKDLRKRVASYFTRQAAHPRIAAMLFSVPRVDYVPCAGERGALILEQKLIRRIQPLYNVTWKDDKSYPFVKLTLEEDYPRLILTRRRKKDGGLYFGPYSSVRIVRKLLRALWKSGFSPLRPCRYEFAEKDTASAGGLAASKPALYRKVKSCVYLHTGACPAPCMDRISKTDYRKIARNAELFFRGGTRTLKEKWEKEMKENSARMKFEMAGELRDRLSAIEHISEDVALSRVDEETLVLETNSSRALTELKETLGCPTPPLRIEGFDISNIQRSDPVGSMVVFERGKPAKQEYRKFRIRTVEGQDDFAMMAEVVKRRYKRVMEEKMKLPDLILIDGGKGQLSAALRSLEELGFNKGVGRKVAIAALAKEDEEIFVPGKEEPIRLPKDSPALHVLQAVRDEAHRFAVAYHRVRRKKTTFGA